MRMHFPHARQAGGGTGKGKREMLRAMDSAVAGLRSHQNKLDVVGHNIANVNTLGFKAQTYTFKEAMYQTSTASTGGQTTTDGTGGSAGTNAAQYGYGTMMGSIGMDMTSSTPTYVGGFNAMIEGDGFFITSPNVKKLESASIKDGMRSANFNYTRVGQFMVDSQGYIVDANKNFVYGFRASDATGGVSGDLDRLRIPSALTPAFDQAPLDCRGIQLMSTGKIMATLPDGTGGDTKTIEIGQIAVATFQNPSGLTKAGGNYYTNNKEDNAGAVAVGKPGVSGIPMLMTGYLEASNVDLAKEFADMITTHRGFQANSKMITVSDDILSELVNMKR